MIYSDLHYPSNVYATLLEKVYGRVEYTGYGADDSDSGEVPDLVSGQARIAAMLESLLPPPPCRILEVGFGLGTLAARLADLGYEVTAISDDPAEVELAVKRHPGGANYLQGRLECFEHRGEAFDVMLCQNSVHFFSPLALLNRAGNLLRPQGQLLLVDAFARYEGADDPVSLPELLAFLQLAERQGFQLRDKRDLSASVPDSLEHMAALLAAEEAVIAKTLSLDVSCLQWLQDRFRDEAGAFRAGSRELVMLSFHLNEGPGLQGREMTDIHGFSPGEIAPLFEQSFSTSFDAALWQWKYGDGRGEAVCIRSGDDGNEVIAHYGGASREILFFGRAHKAMQICDVMVKPEQRSFYSKSGLFYQVAASFLELYVGGTREHLLGFGFPNLKAMHVASRLGLYQKTDDFVELLLPAGAHDAAITEGHEASLFDMSSEPVEAWVQDLWRQMSSCFGEAVIGVRDHAWLRYRYVDHPTRDYLFYVVHDSHSDAARAMPLALLVLQAHGDGWLLMDILAQPEAMRSALAACHVAVNRDQGRAEAPMRCWITAGHAKRLEVEGSRRVSLGIEIPCNRQTPGPATEILADAWWLMPGDMDFM